MNFYFPVEKLSSFTINLSSNQRKKYQPDVEGCNNIAVCYCCVGVHHGSIVNGFRVDLTNPKAANLARKKIYVILSEFGPPFIATKNTPLNF